LLLDVVDVELLLEEVFFVVVYVSGVQSVTLRVPESDSLDHPYQGVPSSD